MSVKKNILTISWISLLLSSEFFLAKAMGPDSEPYATGFIKNKPNGESFQSHFHKKQSNMKINKNISPLLMFVEFAQFFKKLVISKIITI